MQGLTTRPNHTARRPTLGAQLVRPRCHVWLAEDDSEMRRLLVSLLLEDGYIVTAVQDGGSLLDLLRNLADYQADDRPDLIISDIRMPGWTGLDGLAFLRRMDFTIPMLLITAFGDEETHRRAHRYRARVLDKPFDMDELRDAVVELTS